MIDAEFFNDTSDTDELGIVRNHKTRLVKYTDKKGNFLWWSIDVTSTIDEERSSAAGLTVFKTLSSNGVVLVAESGVYDYTVNCDFFQLTNSQKSRALTKRISKPIPIGCTA